MGPFLNRLGRSRNFACAEFSEVRIQHYV